MPKKTAVLDRQSLKDVGAEFITALGYTTADDDKPFKVYQKDTDAEIKAKLVTAIKEFIAGEVKPKKGKKTAEQILQSAPDALLAFIAANNLLPQDEEDEEDEDSEEEDGDEEDEEAEDDDEEGEEDDADEDDADEGEEDTDEEDEDDDEGEEGDEDEDTDGEEGDEADEDDEDEDLAKVSEALNKVGKSRSIATEDDAPRKKKDAKVEALAAEQPARGALVVPANVEAAVVAILKVLAQPGKAVVISVTDISELGYNGTAPIQTAPETTKTTKRSTAKQETEDVQEEEEEAPKKATRKAKASKAPKEAAAPAVKLSREQKKEVAAAVNTATAKIEAQLMDTKKMRSNEARAAYIAEKGIDVEPYLTGPNKGKSIEELGTKKLGNIIRDYTAKRAERIAIKKLTA